MPSDVPRGARACLDYVHEAERNSSFAWFFRFVTCDF